jgi:hypothetical protein
VATKSNIYWEYDLYDSKEKRVSISEYSKAKFFGIYINGHFQGLFEFSEKTSVVNKKNLIEYHAKDILKKIKKSKKRYDELKKTVNFKEEIKADRYNFYYENELFDSKGKKLSNIDYKKAKYFSIYVNGELEGLYEYPRGVSKETKISLIEGQSKTILKRLTKELKKKKEREKEKPEIDFEKISRNYEERDHFISYTYKREVERYTYKSLFYNDFNIELMEDETLESLYIKVNQAIDNFKLKVGKHIKKLRCILVIRKPQDENYLEHISTPYCDNKRQLKEAIYNLIKNFNKDKYIKERYGEIFKDEFLTIEESRIGVLWWKE